MMVIPFLADLALIIRAAERLPLILLMGMVIVVVQALKE